MIEAILIKKKTDDGLIEIQDSVKLGTKYLIDPTTEKTISGFNFKKGKAWTRNLVMANDGTWLPSELLDWPGKMRPS